MKKTLLILSLIFSLLGCDKDEPIVEMTPTITPTITTTKITSITRVKATSGGDILEDGGANVTARGVCWSISKNPTTKDYHTYNGTGTGTFTSLLIDLTEGTTYYLRSYATNKVGTTYGNELSFTTSKGIPKLTTLPITETTYNEATSGGNILDDGGNNLTTTGVCWSTSINPTTSDYFANNETGTAEFVSLLTNLTENTTYYLRSYATYEGGTVYGNELSFKTKNSIYEGDLTLITQEEVDNFGNQGYLTVTGNIQIGTSYSSINNLKKLSQLVSIGGNLAIHNTFSLTNLEGLNNLSSLEGFLSISGNNNLTSLGGLNSLTHIGGAFFLDFNRSLANLEGLNNLSSIGGEVSIYLNENLASFSGLNYLTSIGGNLLIRDNNSLTNLYGLNNLSSVEGEFRITTNKNLKDFCAINLLTSNLSQEKYKVSNNKYNPTLQDLIDGNCNQ